MRRYLINFLDGRDAVILTRIFHGKDDAAARGEAHRLSGSHTIQILCEDRLVARAEKKTAPYRRKVG